MNPQDIMIAVALKSWNQALDRATQMFSNLTPAFAQLTADEWLERHASVSEEDFAKEPLRNRFAILLSRTNHLGFHLGQIVLTKKKV